MESCYGFTTAISDRTMERYKEIGENSINNSISMTATDIVEYRLMQEDTSLRNIIQMKVGSIDSYSGSKSTIQLRKDKIKRRQGSPHVLRVHLQLKYPEVCQPIPLLNDTDQSSIITPNNGNMFYCKRLSIEPIQPKELNNKNLSSKLKKLEGRVRCHLIEVSSPTSEIKRKLFHSIVKKTRLLIRS